MTSRKPSHLTPDLPPLVQVPDLPGGAHPAKPHRPRAKAPSEGSGRRPDDNRPSEYLTD
jgi:hypothetical protein